MVRLSGIVLMIIMCLGGLAKGMPPTADAGSCAIAGTGQQITLNGSGSSDDADIVLYEWFVKGSGGFVEAPEGRLVINAPAQADSSFYCILRVTDNAGFSNSDTVIFWVVDDFNDLMHRIIFPDGGEQFRIGDTVTVVLWPVNRTAGLKLRVGDKIFSIPGFSGNINPAVHNSVTFVIPDYFYEQVWSEDSGRYLPVSVSPVSDSCKIQVFDYFDPSSYVLSADYFSIEAPGAILHRLAARAGIRMKSTIVVPWIGQRTGHEVFLREQAGSFRVFSLHGELLSRDFPVNRLSGLKSGLILLQSEDFIAR